MHKLELQRGKRVTLGTLSYCHYDQMCYCRDKDAGLVDVG